MQLYVPETKKQMILSGIRCRQKVHHPETVADEKDTIVCFLCSICSPFAVSFYLSCSLSYNRRSQLWWAWIWPGEFQGSPLPGPTSTSWASSPARCTCLQTSRQPGDIFKLETSVSGGRKKPGQVEVSLERRTRKMNLWHQTYSWQETSHKIGRPLGSNRDARRTRLALSTWKYGPSCSRLSWLREWNKSVNWSALSRVIWLASPVVVWTSWNAHPQLSREWWPPWTWFEECSGFKAGSVGGSLTASHNKVSHRTAPMQDIYMPLWSSEI